MPTTFVSQAIEEGQPLASWRFWLQLNSLIDLVFHHSDLIKLIVNVNGIVEVPAIDNLLAISHDKHALHVLFERL